MSPATMTYELAMAAGHDAANRRMRRDNRQAWNEDDWNEAVETFNRLFPDPLATVKVKEEQ